MISVILCVYNGEEYLQDQLASLAKQRFDGDWELIVVDDQSTDATPAIAAAWLDRLPLRIERVASGSGLSNARNVGIDAAHGDLLLFCDADDVADEGWLGAMSAAAGDAGVLGGHLEETSLNTVVARWRYPSTAGALPRALGRWSTPVGANMGLRVDVLRAVGRFDPSLRTGEEIDIAIRAQLLGYDVKYVPDAVVHYRHRDDLRGSARQAYQYGRGNAELYERYRPYVSRQKPARAVGAAAWRIARGVPGALVDEGRRGAWLRYVGYTAGQLAGGIRNRAVYIG